MDHACSTSGLTPTRHRERERWWSCLGPYTCAVACVARVVLRSGGGRRARWHRTARASPSTGRGQVACRGWSGWLAATAETGGLRASPCRPQLYFPLGLVASLLRSALIDRSDSAPPLHRNWHCRGAHDFHPVHRPPHAYIRARLPPLPPLPRTPRPAHALRSSPLPRRRRRGRAHGRWLIGRGAAPASLDRKPSAPSGGQGARGGLVRFGLLPKLPPFRRLLWFGYSIRRTSHL